MREPSPTPAPPPDDLAGVAGASSGRSRLLGRRTECEELDQLVADVSAGSSRVLVLRGEAGVGKSALLTYLSGRTASWRVTSAVGVESETELAYSGLHQVCAPVLEHLEKLPVPQREALATVFGLQSGPSPDRFLVGLATLTLISEAAEEQPLACLVEDAQWLDSASGQILAFVARRLLAERVALVFAARTGSGEDVLAGLPTLEIRGLGYDDARSLLTTHVRGPLDPAVVDQIVAESHGNPLALLELPRAWAGPELAGGFALPDGRPVAGKIEQSYVRRLRELSLDTQMIVLTAAAEPTGDPVLLRRAADLLGLDLADLIPAVDAGLLAVRARVEFAHPLVRSAAYHAATTDNRYRAHRALAEATDAEVDPDRRAWHRARAAAGPDEEIAVELERSAGRAQARGGVAAGAAFLERAVALSQDRARRVERALAAAQASLHAGSFGACLRLVALAEGGPLDERQRALVTLLRARAAFATGLDRGAPPLLLEAARRLEPLDLELARETYLIAWVAAVFAGDLGNGKDLAEISRAARAGPWPPGPPRPLDLLLDGLAVLATEGRAAAVPLLQRAAEVLPTLPLDDVLRWGWAATAASNAVWDDEGTRAIAARQVALVREAGALAQLQLPLSGLGNAYIWSGDFAQAASLHAEAEALAAATGSTKGSNTALRLLAMQGKEREAAALIARTIEESTAKGRDLSTVYACWAASVLYNGLGRHHEAKAAGQRAASATFERFASMWALPELVEAAVRTGDIALAHDAFGRLAETTRPCRTEFALGIEARCGALVSEESAADELYREAVHRLSRCRLRPELARAHLLYGEWLRSMGRGRDAREQLSTAYTLFADIGMGAFAERARRELIAAGEKVRAHNPELRDELTPQEEQIARLARDGLSNPEIGAQLFISARTVEWHLRKVFTKLGITSRRDLRRALPDQASDGRGGSSFAPDVASATGVAEP